MTKSRGILAPRRRWTPEEDALLRAQYADTRTADLAEQLGRSVVTVYSRAYALGLEKSEAFRTSPASGRMRSADARGEATRYTKGVASPNKGLRRPGYTRGEMQRTQFKKGRHASEAYNYLPIGATRVRTDGLLEQKVTDDPTVYPAKRWRFVHRLVWEAAHGPVPAGMRIAFKPGMRTNVREEITLDRLELVTQAELMQRNTIHNLPAPIVEALYLVGAVRRHINRRARREEQDRRLA